jgi:putative Mg2+ transporter-C (MgtC) family protein
VGVDGRENSPILLPIAERAAAVPWADLNAAFRLDLLAKLALAVVLGGAIGLEREIKAKPAGLRTNILICVGSVLLTDVSVRIGLIDGGPRVGDPARLAAQIVSGIGFLGAGTIMQGSGMVTGLTSAATIWVVAALGIAIGAGLYVEAAGAGLLVMVVLASLGRVEHKIRRLRRIVNYTVRTKPSTPFDVIRDALDAHGIIVVSQQAYDHMDDRTFELRLTGPAIQFETLTDTLMARADVLSVHGGGGG